MEYEPAFLGIANSIAEELSLKTDGFVGHGAFKETYRVIDKNNEPKALKVLNPKKCNLARTSREIEAMKKCTSDRIGRLFGYGEYKLPDGTPVYFSVEEYLDGGTLTDRLNAGILDAATAKFYAISLCEAIEHLKCHDLVHRDIKPDNIMFRSSSNTPVLVDLGLVRDLSMESLTQTWIPHGPGTPLFSAPEQLNNDKQMIDWRTDQFSLGLVIGYMLTGRHAFQNEGETIPQAIENVALRKQVSDCFSRSIDQAGFSPVLKMLEVWPIKRYPDTNMLLKSISGIGG